MIRTLHILAIFLALGSDPCAAYGSRQSNPSFQARLVLELPRPSDADSVILQNPVGATRFADGTIAVADGMAPALLFFGADGRLTRVVGRAGRGPNEFSTPGWLGRCGEEEATVWDFSLLRFTTVGASGRILAQSSLRDRFDVPRPPAVLSCSRSGHVAVLLRLAGDRIEARETSVLTSPLYLVRQGGGTTLLDPAAPVIEWINEERTYRPVSMTTHFTVSDARVFIARSDSAVVREYDLGGNLTRTIALDLPRRAPTDAHVRRDAERHTAFTSDRAARARIVERSMKLPRPANLPYHNGIHLDPLGMLWVVQSFPGDTMTSLLAFRLDGEAIGIVEVPADLKVLEVGDGYVLGSLLNQRTLEPSIALFTFDLGR